MPLKRQLKQMATSLVSQSINQVMSLHVSGNNNVLKSLAQFSDSSTHLSFTEAVVWDILRVTTESHDFFFFYSRARKYVHIRPYIESCWSVPHDRSIALPLHSPSIFHYSAVTCELKHNPRGVEDIGKRASKSAHLKPAYNVTSPFLCVTFC